MKRGNHSRASLFMEANNPPPPPPKKKKYIYIYIYIAFAIFIIFLFKLKIVTDSFGPLAQTNSGIHCICTPSYGRDFALICRNGLQYC